MSDNTRLPVGTADGDTYASDDISSVKFQRVKITLGADGTNDGDVSSSNKMPVSASIAAAQTLATVTTVGTITNTVPVSQLAATIPTATTMQNAAAATGNGTLLDVQGYATAVINITQTGTSTVSFEM